MMLLNCNYQQKKQANKRKEQLQSHFSLLFRRSWPNQITVQSPVRYVKNRLRKICASTVRYSYEVDESFADRSARARTQAYCTRFIKKQGTVSGTILPLDVGPTDWEKRLLKASMHTVLRIAITSTTPIHSVIRHQEVHAKPCLL
jgi:hypothetical protein